MNEASYISLLDMQRVMQRVLKRSGLPVWHTLGFNPHIYMTFACPLSLGQESECECVDVKTEAEAPDFEQWKAALNAIMPAGIVITHVGPVQMKADLIAYACYRITYPAAAAAALDQYNALESAPVEKHGKKGNKIIELKEEDEFKLKKQQLLDAITDKTKILIMPFPNNPTGAIMTREDLEDIAEVVREHDLFVISDEIYSELTYSGDHVSIASLPGMQERTIVINGFSKSYAMTGWRLGYACGPQAIIKQMLKIHQFAIMCAPTLSQYAAISAVRDGDADVERMRMAYNQRRNYLMKAFRDMGLKCFEPFGAFYVFPSIKEFGMTSDEFATKLLQEEKVAVVPGTAFGQCGEGFLRISYAYSIDDLKIALGRMQNFIDRHRK